MHKTCITKGFQCGLARPDREILCSGGVTVVSRKPFWAEHSARGVTVLMTYKGLGFLDKDGE